MEFVYIFIGLVVVLIISTLIQCHADKVRESDPRKHYLLLMESTNFERTNLYKKVKLIGECIEQYKLAQFGRFYTVYCCELYNSFLSIANCPIDSLRSEEMRKLSEAYMPIFDKMLDDIKDAIRLQISVDCSAKVIEWVSKAKGDRYDWEV